MRKREREQIRDQRSSVRESERQYRQNTICPDPSIRESTDLRSLPHRNEAMKFASYENDIVFVFTLSEET